MEKFKLINCKADNIEIKVNKWLVENKDVKIKKRKVILDNGFWYVMIWYKDKE